MRKVGLLEVLGVVGLMGLMLSAPVSASGTCPAGSIQTSYTNSLAECNLEDTSTSSGLMNTVKIAINVVLGIVGLLAVIFIIVGGYKYVMSQGNPEKVKAAKDTILYSIVGLIIALLAFAIVNFVLTSVFS